MAEGAKKEKLGQAEFVNLFIDVVGLDGQKGTLKDVAKAAGLAYGSVVQRFSKYTKPVEENGYGIALPTPRRSSGGQRVDAAALNALIAERAKAAEAEKSEASA